MYKEIYINNIDYEQISGEQVYGVKADIVFKDCMSLKESDNLHFGFLNHYVLAPRDYIIGLENKVEELKAVEKYYRQRTKDLEDTQQELGLMECRVKNANEIISKMQRYKINRAIEYCKKIEKENKKMIDFEILHDEYQHIEAQAQNELIYDLLKILEGGFKK